MELIHLKDDFFYLKGAVNMGLININGKIVLIDSGIDKQTAKGIEKVVKEKKWSITHIINTHAHADHFSGSQYLKESFQAKVLAPKIEGIIMEYPAYEPFYLFGSAHPIKELKNKFLQGSPVIIDQYLQPGPLKMDGENLEIVPLPGHTMGQIGVLWADVLYLADAAFGQEIIKKHGIPYFVDIDLQLKTLDYLETLKCSYYIPSHGNVVTNIKDLTVYNRQFIYNLTYQLKDFLPGTSEEIVTKILNYFQVKVTNPGQYYLLRATIMAYLSFLNNTGEITWEMAHNNLRWKKLRPQDKCPVLK